MATAKTKKTQTAPLPWIIIGNPENRRVSLFREALVSTAPVVVTVVPWIDLVNAVDDDAVATLIPNDGGEAIVRIDSFGEDFNVTRALLHHGVDDARDAGVWTLSHAEIDALEYDRGRILAPKQEHLGFLRVLRMLARVLAARSKHLHVAPSPKSIELLFDKSACARAFSDAKIPMARALFDVTNAHDLRARMESEKIRRVFVKLTCGSSASCLALFHSDKSEQEEWLFTSMETEGDRFYNSLRPRRYKDRGAIDRVLEFLFREGSHVEEHVAKSRLRGRFFDTRMVAIEGEVAFTVMRKSGHPITNLHLGGERGTPEELEEAIADDVRAAAHESCRRVAELLDVLHVGVDVMFTEDRLDHRVLEANAFGDLLPNLTRDGLSVYEWEIRAMLARVARVSRRRRNER